MKLKSAIIAAAVASVFSVSAQAATDLVTNGSFEADLQGAGSWNIYSGLTGWSLSSGSGIELRNNVAGASQDGVNYVELDSGGNSAISQTLITVASQLYDVSFWYSPREGVSAESNPIEFWWNGSLIDTVTGVGASSGNVWGEHTYQLIASSASTVLQFAAVGVDDSYGGSLDNISVSAVPEPETYAMFMAGLGLMGFIARRRKSA